MIIEEDGTIALRPRSGDKILSCPHCESDGPSASSSNISFKLLLIKNINK